MVKRIALKHPYSRRFKRAAGERAVDQGGWALLSLILALTIMGIVLASSVQPNYQLAVQREKEDELFYRGQQMAEGITRWYNFGNLNPQSQIVLGNPPTYGFLKELKKLKEGLTINLKPIKFVRPSATIDPFDGKEWDPVYARDPRIMPFLPAWAAETGGIIPQQWMLIAGPPARIQLVKPANGSSPTTRNFGQSGTSGATGTNGNGETRNPQTGTTTGTQRGNQNKDLDDDDDDDENPNDPLAHLFGSNGQGLPIVGVAPRRKGPSVRAYYGLKN